METIFPRQVSPFLTDLSHFFLVDTLLSDNPHLG
jgi:hypothetical protein